MTSIKDHTMMEHTSIKDHTNIKEYTTVNKHDYLFRTIIVGNSRSGKSTFCKSYAKGFSCIESVPTIGVDFISKKHQLENGVIIKINLWDTAGQEAFNAIVKTYYRDICGAIIVFDITDRESFNNVPTWLRDVRTFNSCDHKHPTILVGNKSDLKKSRNIAHDEALDYANSENLLYVESSCYNIEGIETIMHHFYSHMYDTFIENGSICKGVKKSDSEKNRSFSSSGNKDSLCRNKYMNCC
jgi:small GTP-binding protein